MKRTAAFVKENALPIAGAFVLLVAMGIGRFGYTPMLALMLREADLSARVGAFAAPANLLGYLVGSIGAMSPPMRSFRVLVVRISVGVIVVSTAAMVVPWPTGWLICRFVTGVASGFAFVLCSSVVLDGAAKRGRPWWSPLYYAGVGVAIALTGIIVPVLGRLGGWRAGWIGLACTAALGSLALAFVSESEGSIARSAAVSAGTTPRRVLFSWLLVAYGSEGLGYIVPATFMVAMIEAQPAIASFADRTWVLVGLVAAPSTLDRGFVGTRLGRPLALVSALFVQAVVVANPAFVTGPVTTVLAAVAIGGINMGVTMLGSALARDLHPERSNVAIGALTAFFGI